MLIRMRITLGTIFLLFMFIFIPLSKAIINEHSAESFTDGQPIRKCDFLYWDGKDIHLKYDILNDINNMTVVATVNDFPMHSPSSHWKSNGGPTITKGPDNIWYIITRYRIGEQFNNTWGRGHYYGCYKSNDLQNWERIWLVNRTNITGGLYTTYSFEQCTLRFYNNTWYFYFTSPLNGTYNWNTIWAKASTFGKIFAQVMNHFTFPLSGTYNWNTIWVKASSVEKIYSVMMNQTYWHVVDKKTPGYDRWKGSWFGYDEEYYWTPGHGNGSQSIKKNHYPELNIWETSSSYTGCGNARIIFFDIQSQKYITWGHKKVGSDILWCYCVFSDKLETLESRINHTIISNTSTYGGNARHVDYYCFAPYSYVIIMAYDYDKDGNEETCLWDYRTNDK